MKTNAILNARSSSNDKARQPFSLHSSTAKRNVKDNCSDRDRRTAQMIQKNQHRFRVANWAGLSPHSRKGLGLSMLADWAFQFGVCTHVLVSSGCSGFLPQTKNMPIRSNGFFKM